MMNREEFTTAAKRLGEFMRPMARVEAEDVMDVKPYRMVQWQRRVPSADAPAIIAEVGVFAVETGAYMTVLRYRDEVRDEVTIGMHAARYLDDGDKVDEPVPGRKPIPLDVAVSCG